jgi:hypothetical protein
MKKATGVTKGPVGPDGEFMVFGTCEKCHKGEFVYLYGTPNIKGRCGRCVEPSKEVKVKKKKSKRRKK